MTMADATTGGTTAPARGDLAATAALLARHADALTARALAAMYRNPFWDARFGERGRRYAEEDGRHHLGYLHEALLAGGPESLVRYARWLQTVLVTRGMCSRHLADHFARLRDAVRAELGTERTAAALAYLDEAEAALLYDVPTARAVQQSIDDERGVDDPLSVRYLVSYLGDAVARARPDLFGDYVRWCRAHAGSDGARLDRALVALDAALARLDPAARDAARRALALATTGGDR